MGLSKWMAKRFGVGAGARAVAKGWNTISSQNPDMKPTEIAEAYIKFRYGLTGETDLEKRVLLMVEKGAVIGPVSLAWEIFEAETLRGKSGRKLMDAHEALWENRDAWEEIIEEELRKAGIDPELA